MFFVVALLLNIDYNHHLFPKYGQEYGHEPFSFRGGIIWNQLQINIKLQELIRNSK